MRGLTESTLSTTFRLLFVAMLVAGATGPVLAGRTEALAADDGQRVPGQPVQPVASAVVTLQALAEQPPPAPTGDGPMEGLVIPFNPQVEPPEVDP